MKKNKATGPDQIQAEVLQWLPHTIHQDVAELLNDWWNTGTIDPDITKSKVFMAYKKGDSANFANY
eukprot:8014589-Prorocentrum_lima.AAC.1